jgi:hypothetical protein
MKYRCMKGFTTRDGKHYFLDQIISEHEYNDLNIFQRSRFLQQGTVRSVATEKGDFVDKYYDAPNDSDIPTKEED